MPLSDSPAHQTSIDRFFANYLFILEKNEVPTKSIPWYRKHVEAYIKASNTPLNPHTGQAIDFDYRQIIVREATRLFFSTHDPEQIQSP